MEAEWSINLEAEWGSWHEIEGANFNEGDYFGIYEIQMVNQVRRPIPISRIGGIDEEGIIYIGRSGLKRPRTLGMRLHEFQIGRHSGAKTYELVSEELERLKPAYSNHKLQYRAIHLPVDKVKGGMPEIEFKEGLALGDYFSKCGELPPCNSNFSWFKSFRGFIQKEQRNK
jgi:hypothetical protein